MFVQIASLCLSDQKDVSLCPNIPYHYTGAGRAAGQGGGGAGARGCPSECPAPPSRRTSPTPTAKQRQTHAPSPHFTEAPAMATCILPHTPAGAFSRMCPEPALDGCLPAPPHGVCAWGVSPALPAARQDGDWETEAGQQSPGPHPAQGVNTPRTDPGPQALAGKTLFPQGEPLGVRQPLARSGSWAPLDWLGSRPRPRGEK